MCALRARKDDKQLELTSRMARVCGVLRARKRKLRAGHHAADDGEGLVAYAG